ncbi:helix-turn-helix transcriptional regulator [Actinomadura luteofluorescens]|uniref:helix-turn-helix domain-containing protein n=1 Tax=Actinomadura luteofluorescens TaxID=46163 RepID=UPI0030CE053B
MPIVRDPIEPRLSIYHFLAFYLRFLREKAGLSLTQVGKIIGVARSSVCNMEAGRQRPQEDHVAKLDEYYGTGKLLQLLLWFARLAHDPNWLCDVKSHVSSECMIGGRWKVGMHSRLVPEPVPAVTCVLAS